MSGGKFQGRVWAVLCCLCLILAATGAGAVEYPPAPLEVLNATSLSITTTDGAEICEEIPVPEGTELVFFSLTSVARGWVALRSDNFYGERHAIAETDGMAAMDSTTWVFCYKLPPNLYIGGSLEFLARLDSEDQDPFGVLLTTVCVRGADMTHFPEGGTPFNYSGPHYEASTAIVDDGVDYNLIERFRRGDMLLTLIGAMGDVGEPSAQDMQKASSVTAGRLSGGAAFTRVPSSGSIIEVAWDGAPTEYSMFMLPLRSRCFGTVQVNITPQAAINGGARWRANWGREWSEDTGWSDDAGEWLPSGELAAGQPLGVWPFLFSDVPGFITPDPVVEVLADELVVVEAKYRRIGAPEVLQTDTYQGVLTESGGYELVYSGNTPWEAELLLLVLSVKSGDELELESPPQGFSMFTEYPGVYPQQMPVFGPAEDVPVQTRIFFMKRPQLLPGASYNGDLMLSPTGEPHDIPYTLSAVFLRGVDLDAFGNHWDASPAHPAPVFLSGVLSETEMDFSYSFEAHLKPLNGATVFSVMSSPGLGMAVYDRNHDELWNSTSPGGGISSVGAVRLFEPELDDTTLSWDFGVEGRGWSLVLLTLPPAGRGDLQITLNNDVAGEDAMWRFDGGGWRLSGETAQGIPSGWRWVEFMHLGERAPLAPSPRWVHVAKGALTSEAAAYSPQGVPHPVYQFSFTGKTDYQGVLRLRSVTPPGLGGMSGSLTVAALGADSGVASLVREGAANTFTKWVQSPEAKERATLFFRKYHTVPADSAWRFEYGAPNTIVSGAVMIFDNVQAWNMPANAPFTNVAGGSGTASPANVLNPLTGGTAWDVLCGAIQGIGTVSLNTAQTQAAIKSVQLWREPAQTGNPVRSFAGYTSLAAPPKLTTAQQGPAFNTGGGWGGAEAMLPASRGEVRVTINSPELAARPEMVWQVAGGEPGRVSGQTSVSLTGWQKISIPEPTDFWFENPEALWVYVDEDDTTDVILNFREMYSTSLRVAFMPAAVQADARWRVLGLDPEGDWLRHRAFFRNITVQDLARGHFEVEFNALDGYSTPETRAFAVEEGTVNAYTVTYQQQGRIIINIEPPEAAAQNPMWRFEGTDTMHLSGEEVLGNSGPATLRFSSLRGWLAPSPLVVVPFNETRTYTVRYEPIGTPRMAGQTTWRGRTNGDWTKIDVPLPATRPDLSVVAVTWQGNVPAPATVALDEVQNHTLWASNTTGTARAALYYLKNPTSTLTSDNKLWVRFGGTAPEFSMQVCCMFFNSVDLSVNLTPLANSFAGAPPRARLDGREVVQNAGLSLSLLSVMSGEFSPDLDNVFKKEEADPALVWKEQETGTGKALGGGGGLVTGRAITGTSWANMLYWDCESNWAGVTGTIPVATGSLRVTIQPPAAVAAGVKWNAYPLRADSDSGVTRHNVHAGMNMLSHNNINGWAPDPAYSPYLTVPTGGQINTTYYFLQVPPSGVRVTLFPPEAVAAGAQWRLADVDGMPWQNSGATFTGIPKTETSYLVEFKDVSGWSKPNRRDLWVKSGENTEDAAVYTRAASLRVTIKPDSIASGKNFCIWDRGQRCAASGGTIEDIVPGVYDISVPPVAGYLSPLNDRVSVNPGDRLDIVMTYEKAPAVGVNELIRPGWVTTVIEPPEAAAAGARWRLEGYAWTNSAQTIENLRPGVAKVFLSDVDGWYPTGPMTVVVPSGRGVAIRAYYDRVQRHELGEIPEIEAVQGRRTAIQITLPPSMPPGTVLSHSFSSEPDGARSFNPASGVFTYTAAETDNEPFLVNFCATPPAGQAVCQTVAFIPVTAPVTEDELVEPVDPNAGIPDENAKEYITITDGVSMTTRWNGLDSQEIRDVMITGKTLRFQEGHQNNLHAELHNNRILDRVSIFAEKVVIAGRINLPGATLTITARTLEFEDLPSNPAVINLTPLADTALPGIGSAGMAGQACGGLILKVEQCKFSHSSSIKRFILNGAKGQAGGPGSDGTKFAAAWPIVGNGSYGWQDKVKNAGVPAATRTEMVGRIVYLHNTDVSQARGTAEWPPGKDANDEPLLYKPLIARGAPGNGGRFGTLNAPFGELAALIDADWGPGGTLHPVVPTPADPLVPNPAFWVWIGDPGTNGPSAATRAREDVKHLTLNYKKTGDWKAYWYRNELPNASEVVDLTSPALIFGKPNPPLNHLGAGTEDEWICPEVLQPALMFLKDLYLNGHTERVRNSAMEYLNRIHGRLQHNPPASADRRLITALADEFDSIYQRAAAGLDYFGNPPGWTPMLSFEANASFYRQEFESAIPTLFLARWMEEAASRSQREAAALNAGIEEQDKLIEKHKADLSKARNKLPPLISKVTSLDMEEAALTAQINALEARLREMAEEEAKPKWYETAFKVAKAVLKAIPIPETQLIGGALDLVGNFSWDGAVRLADQAALYGLSGEVTKFSTNLDAVWNSITSIGVPSLSMPSREQAAAFYGEYRTKASELAGSVDRYQKAIPSQGVSSSEVEKILAEMRAKSFKFQQLTTQLGEFKEKKDVAANEFNVVTQTITTATNGIGAAVTALGEKRHALTTNLRSQDHRARQYFKDLDQRVRHRLLKQHYYMKKAYEFRTLQPYPNSLKLSQGIMDSLMNIVSEPGHGPTLTGAEINLLKTPFENEMRLLVNRFVDDANSSTPGMATVERYELNPAQLAELNRTKRLTLNLQKLGLLFRNQEHHRLARMCAIEMDVTYRGGNPSNAKMSITFTHSGVSRMRSGGKTYAFQHYKDAEVSPIRWDTFYNHANGALTQAFTPRTEDSILAFMSGTLNRDIFYYCVPSAWADVIVRVDENLDAGKFTINRMKIEYDIHYKAKANVPEVYVFTEEGIAPPIRVSRPDTLSGKTGGSREFFRRFGANSGTVTISTDAVHGNYAFAYWMVNGTQVFSKTAVPSVSVPTVLESSFVVPVFERKPVSVPNLAGATFGPKVEPPPGTNMDVYEYPLTAYSKAEYLLVGNGLLLGDVRYERTGSAADKNKVLRQFPEAAAVVPHASKVHIVVSTGTDTPPAADPVQDAADALLAGFEAFDTNGDGVLSWEEALAAWPGLWPEDFEELDADGSGGLTPEEVGYIEPLCDIRSRASVFRMLLLLSGDPDENGMLSKQEFQDLTGFGGILMNQWGQLDTNGDNMVSMAEFTASGWNALTPLFTLDANGDNAVSLEEYRTGLGYPTFPATVFNAADVAIPRNGLIDCEDLEYLTVGVPNVVGQTQSAATATLGGTGLVPGAITQQHHATAPAGTVLGQSPAPGTQVAPGSAVALTVSQGPPPVAVPNVVGQTQAAATAAITGAGFSVGTVTMSYHATIPKDRVISQNPAADTMLAPGAAVSLTVSRGPAPVAVPDVVGQTQAAATAALTGAGLTPGTVTEEYHPTVPAGTVLGQNPAAGTEVAAGSAVALTVSRGPAPAEFVTVPNVVGQTQAAASSVLTGAGLATGAVSQQFHASVPAGSIISQNPVAGVQVAPGSAVALVVSKGPAPVTVPNVVGQTQAAAAAALTGAGLSVGEVSQSHHASVPAGSVISQNPAAGAEVAPGSAVALVVSKGPAPVAVPNVVGMTQAAATTAITGAGLNAGAVSQEFHATVPAGTVFGQNPAAGMEVATGTAVALTVSKGPAPAEYVTVPNVTGQTQAAASGSITGAGLLTGAVTLTYHATVPEGAVISQTPAAGSQVPPGDTVALVVSLGPPVEAQVPVPSVTGQTLAAATGTLTGAGLTLGEVANEYHATAPEGVVIAQNPAAGAELAPGGAVSLVLSKGPAPAEFVTVPDVTGQTQADAVAALGGAALVAGTVTQSYSSLVTAGSVISQSPVAGTQVLPGAPVSLVVSLGPLPVGDVAVPDMLGMTRAEAEAALATAGMALGAVTEQYHPTVVAGRVISQTPSPGVLAALGTAISLTLSKGPVPAELITVPNVVGQTQAAASAAISALGLVPGAVTQTHHPTIPAGVVISQSPVAGVQLAAGGGVDLVVSKGPAPVVVPNVVGLTQAAASGLITGAGLAVGTVAQEFHATVPAGTVFGQTPAAGTELPPGGAVAITVSKGPAPVEFVTVPGVVGQTQAAAGTTLAGAGLAVGTVTQTFHATVPAGTVISQNPAAGAQVAPGSAVALTVSKGPQPVAVPNVVGLAQASATSAITGAGLSLGTVTQAFHATIPAGTVITQNPSAGTEVAPGTAVALTVSKGPQPVAVPNVVGQTQASATNAITGAGLSLGTVTQMSHATVPAGTVISQNPAAGTEVAPETAVALTVSKGPLPVAVPNVVGQTQASATSAITGVGLSLGTVTQMSHATVPAGTVISQNPAAGTEVAPGTAVALTVSKGPQPVAVPNVVGQTQASATSAITGAGLALGTVTQEFHATVAAGNVISQNPAAGIEVAPGTAVALTVSKGPAPVAVPDVVGLTRASATGAITGAGLILGTVTEEFHATIPVGQVMAQSPAAGTEVAPGSAVALTVSKGPVPPTSGEAQALLAAAFDAADTDGNGRISFAEASAVVRGLTQAVFNALDTNGDGELDRSELGLPDEGGCGCGGGKSILSPAGLKKRLGDLFLAGLMLGMLALWGARRK